MPREVITVHVGQCGNQLGTRFWQLALGEHAALHRAQQQQQQQQQQGGGSSESVVATYDDALSTFFRNVDGRDRPHAVGSPIDTLRARAVMVDMEEGPVTEALRGPLGGVLDRKLLLTDVSGSGNNWACGHDFYGNKYADDLLELLRTAAEDADSLQGFFMTHSMGGGTGSGVGSATLELLADAYPKVFKLAASVFPSEDDDVVTSPYNALLTLKALADGADAVVPLENQALIDMVRRAEITAKRSERSAAGSVGARAAAARASAADAAAEARAAPFDSMNALAADVLLGLTASTRFGGELNVDLSEITTNLVPFPRRHMLLASAAPVPPMRRAGSEGARSDPRAPPQRPAPTSAHANAQAVSASFALVSSREAQLVRADVRSSAALCCALLARGNLSVDDVQRGAARFKKGLRFAHWNLEGVKWGLCSAPPEHNSHSVLALTNSCAIRHTVGEMTSRFKKLYSRKAFVHEYTKYTDASTFDEALESARELIDGYASVDAAREPDAPMRLRPIGR